ncbi:MAG: STM4011 family radical SAM protein [Polyangiaceae bacterium]
MSQTWNILYRGSLSSCNYACDYCPFAKTSNTREELAQDAAELSRFVAWVAQRRDRRVGVLFTPWGEALIRSHYREAMLELSHLEHVYRVAIQTNLSCELDWLSVANRDTLALWVTFHPSQVSRERFLQRCRELDRLSVRYSVGVVGLREHFEEIEALRRELQPNTYLWLNAYKRDPEYYAESDLRRLREVDPYFDLNRRYYPSLGKACHAGHTSFTVSGDGDVRRCHFIQTTLGNLYETDITERLRAEPCTNLSCGCHIGYVHRPELELYDLFGDGVLERIPAEWPTRRRLPFVSP